MKLGKHFCVQSKYNDSIPVFVECKKDSESTGKNGTQVKPVLLAVDIFAVHSKQSAQIQIPPGSNHSQSLLVGNFAALWFAAPKFLVIKVFEEQFKGMLCPLKETSFFIGLI